MNSILTPQFFDHPVLEVAPELLGKYLVRSINGAEIALQINEVEAYDGPEDLACHARFGKTKRTAPMFGPAAHFYVYFVYGMHHMLNVVSGPVDYPAAILIRGAGQMVGPARLTKRLAIGSEFNALPISPCSDLWIEDRGVYIPENKIMRTPRIGVDYAGPIWSKKPYRFVLVHD